VSRAFEIEIIDQGWLEPGERYDPERQDLCTHGRVHLVIGGEMIADSAEGEYGISEAALALLRTLESDHTQDSRVAERLITHGCGNLMWGSCPIGIDWTVEHLADGRVRLAEVLRYDTTSKTPTVRFPEIETELQRAEYVRTVVAFAEHAKEPFRGVTKEFSDEFDREEFENFWIEYEDRLRRARPQ
jgi:hypothetical protein